MPMGPHYVLLGLTHTTVSQDQIKSAYKKKALETHPDKNGGTKVSGEAFKAVLAAYKVLSDVVKKFDYDGIHGTQSAPIPTPTPAPAPPKPTPTPSASAPRPPPSTTTSQPQPQPSTSAPKPPPSSSAPKPTPSASGARSFPSESKPAAPHTNFNINKSFPSESKPTAPHTSFNINKSRAPTPPPSTPSESSEDPMPDLGAKFNGFKPFWKGKNDKPDTGGSTLWLGGLTFKTTEVMIRLALRSAGDIEYIVLHEVEPRPYAFVRFSARAGALKARETLDGVKIDGATTTFGWARDWVPKYPGARPFWNDPNSKPGAGGWGGGSRSSNFQ